MAAMYVQLDDSTLDRLRELARRELRDPREQASWLILEGLRREGLVMTVPVAGLLHAADGHSDDEERQS